MTVRADGFRLYHRKNKALVELVCFSRDKSGLVYINSEFVMRNSELNNAKIEVFIGET